MKNDQLLTTPIETLDVSMEFNAMANANNFKSIQEIVQIPVYELLQMPRFTFRVLNELISILQTNKLECILIED